jgi:hypothetical protein
VIILTGQISDDPRFEPLGYRVEWVPAFEHHAITFLAEFCDEWGAPMEVVMKVSDLLTIADAVRRAGVTS